MNLLAISGNVTLNINSETFISMKIPVQKEDYRLKKLQKEIESLRQELENLSSVGTRKAHESFRKREELYRQLVESANTIIIRFDRTGTLTYINQFALEYFGYSREEMIGRNVTMIVPEKERSGRDLSGLVKGIISEPDKYIQSENQNILRNGDMVWISWSNRPVLDEFGDLVEILSIGYDITMRKKAEEALKTEHDILEAVISNTGTGFLVIDMEGNIKLFNNAALQIHNLTIKEEKPVLNNYIGNYKLQYLDGKDIPRDQWPLDQAFHGHFTNNFETRLIRGDGTSRMVSFSSIPIKDDAGNITLIVFTMTDFTDIYERNEALKESQLRYHSLFSNATFAIQHCRVVTDENGKPVDYEMFHINDTFTRMTGIRKEDVYGKKATEIFPGIRKLTFDFIGVFGKIALEGGEINTEVYFDFLDKWFSMYVYSPIKGEFTSIFTDITERKKSEAELRKAKEKAEESDRLKSAFMANMSHEIRTPMNGILGFAELLKNPKLSGESQKMYIEAISSSGKRMLSIINDLIDIAKIESGQIEIKREPANLRKLLEEEILFFKPEAERRNISLVLESDLPSDDFIIITDKTKLAQILTNLLKNALKFTPENGRIELNCTLKDNKELLFYVSDTGIGIRKELQEKIFERFRQGDMAEIHEGIGLGLAISRAFVEQLGGRLSVESKHGEGSVFYFSIPYVRHSESDKSNTKENKVFNNSPTFGYILIVDDDDMSYTLVREILRRNNLDTLRAENGLEAVNSVRDKRDINLILMDIKLPVMNGIEATVEIKKIRPEIPVIMQSAYASQEEIDRAFAAGCSDYLTKPLNINLLIEKISNLIRK